MRQISAIIEIGTSKVVSVICENGQYGEAHILGSAVANYSGYKNRKWMDKHSLAAAVQSALREAEKIAGKKCKQVHVGIPADFLKVVCIKAEESFSEPRTFTDEDVERLYQQGRSKLHLPKEYMMIHRCPIQFMLDDARKTVEPQGRMGRKLSAIISFVLAERWFTQGISKMLTQYGYTPSTFIGASYAEAVRYVPEEKRDHGAVLVDIGNTSTTVMVVRGDGLIFHKVLGFGGNNITEDILKVFSIKKDMALEIKKRAIFGLSLSEDDFYEVCDKETYKFERFPAIEVQAVIEARMNEMISVISETLDKSGCNLPGYVPVYLTGGTAQMRGLREYAQKLFGHNTVIISPQSTCFNQPSFTSALAVAELALVAETEDEPSFFESIKNIFAR